MGGNDPAGNVPRETAEAVDWYFGTRRHLAERYAAALASSGVERGLIGPREVPRLWGRHVLNCAAVIELIEDGTRLVDVGSGAGLPGLVIAIARPNVSVTLLEPLLRRVTWLEEVVADLGLENVVVLRARAEEPAAGQRLFDIATARAVAPLALLASWSLPLVRPGGQVLALKGASAADELADSAQSLREQGAEFWDLRTCGTGRLAVPTTVVRVVKSSAVPAARRSGNGGRRGGALRPAGASRQRKR